MIHILSKFLPLPFYPVGLTAVLCFFTFMALLFKKTRSAAFYSFLAFVVLSVSSMPVTSHLLVRSLESAYSPQVKYARASAIVLLGGAGVPPLAPRIYPETGEAGDRIMHAARLYRQEAAPLMILTGGKISFLKEYEGSEAEVNEELLVELFDVPRSAILLDTMARNTHDHAPNVRSILQQRGLPLEVIVVTSAMHMPRAVMVFESYGFAVTPAPTDFRAEESFQKKAINYFPQVGALAGTTAALHEYYGMLAYELLGWI
jgi:uncharacterized SAM-binding protein YcdF (DUF218 family)